MAFNGARTVIGPTRADYEDKMIVYKPLDLVVQLFILFETLHHEVFLPEIVK